MILRQAQDERSRKYIEIQGVEQTFKTATGPFDALKDINLNVKNIIIAIFVIGIVGLALEYALIRLATAFTFEEVKT